MRLTQFKDRYGIFGSRGLKPMTATIEDAAAAIRAIETVSEAERLAKRGWGVEDICVKLGRRISREQAKRIVFGERKS